MIDKEANLNIWPPHVCSQVYVCTHTQGSRETDTHTQCQTHEQLFVSVDKRSDSYK